MYEDLPLKFRFRVIHISCSSLQVLHPLNVFSEDDVDAAAEALNDVSLRVLFSPLNFFFKSSFSVLLMMDKTRLRLLQLIKLVVAIFG